MKTSNKALVAVSATLASSHVLAHAGHDHAANTSILSHVAFYGSIAAVIAVASVVAFKVIKNNVK